MRMAIAQIKKAFHLVGESSCDFNFDSSTMTTPYALTIACEVCRRLLTGATPPAFARSNLCERLLNVLQAAKLAIIQWHV